MKSRADLVKGWLLKAENDFINVKMCLSAAQALDTVCFHAQQAAEKCIKAYLTMKEVDFPFIHNLGRLIELCAEHDPSFQSIRNLGERLTPYAVHLRYAADFWPDAQTAQEAYEAALKIKAFVLDRLPKEVRLDTPQEPPRAPPRSP